jgi:hypothetical protein
VALLIALTAACSTTSTRGTTSAASPAEERVSEHVYVLRTGVASMNGARGVSFLVRRAAELTVAAGYSHFAIAEAGASEGFFRLAIFMYNYEYEIPLELFNAETFDANEYKDKPLVPLGLYPGAA